MKKVLVVDDTKNIRTLLTKCLQMEGFEVKTANDGHQAVDVFSRENFDLAFLDIKMPYFSGTEVLKQIREMGITTPVIIITAYATVKNAVECTQMGAVAYLQKPFTSEKVRNVLAELNLAKCDVNTIKSDYKTEVKKMLEEERYSEALTLLKKELSDNPLDANLYLQLSTASKGLGHMEDAEKYFKLYESLRS